MEEWINYQSTKTKAFSGKRLSKQTMTGLKATMARLKEFSLSCIDSNLILYQRVEESL
jgi:hypothetical protein